MTPFEVLGEIRRRTAEAVIAQSGLSHEGLRRHLRSLLSDDSASSGALLQEPVLEGAHPFVTGDEAMSGLSGTLLHPDLVAALDALSDDHEYRFPRSRKPFRHQVDAWRLLAEKEKQSVLVTSGTGSGKTECFLFPILSDLAAQAQGQREALTGVQAIMLYPLNALIESQRERLSAWTKPFGGRLRYCLYNGDLPASARESERRRNPEQVIDRAQLRTSPPPLLVTNITMLEYMLVRSEDQPIINSSKGGLKWIVLDEAHSLVGAAAAEIALLLRRVLLAFAVDPREVRFVATSATIGSGENIKQQLQAFLADVAGIPDSQVHVIEGRRRMPSRPSVRHSGTREDILSAEPARLYNILGSDPQIWGLVERLFGGSVPFSQFDQHARPYGVTASELIYAMSRAAIRASDGSEDRLAPVRLHAFERAIPGMWSCVNPTCAGSPEDWPFGRILSERADHCPSCRAPALEIVSCTECGEAFLEGTEQGPRLTAPLRNPPRDEFAFDNARENDLGADELDDGESETAPSEEETHLVLDRLFAANPTSAARGFWLDKARDWRVADGPAAEGISLLSEDHAGPRACPHCNPGGRIGSELIRPLRFGAPFMLGNAAPILLDGVEPARTEPGERLPSDGRRLLSFTDSRQGTARMAAKLQLESERNFVRSFIYHQVQASMRPAPAATEDLAKAKAEIDQLELALATTRLPALEGILAEKRRNFARLTQGGTDGIAWTELSGRLAERVETSEWIKAVWQGRDEELFADASKVADFLLFREFARRPRRANSVETMGIARLRHPSIDRLTDAQLPNAFRRKGKTIEDWRAYLYAMLTFFVRANGAISISWQMQHWVSSKTRLTSLVGPESHTGGDKRLRGWPNGYLRAQPRSRAVALLVQGLGLSFEITADRSELDECLSAAWIQIQGTLAANPERRVFDFSKVFVAPVTDAFYCPVTRRMLDCAPFGFSPYGLDEKVETRRRAASVSMPQHPIPLLAIDDVAGAKQAVQEWIEMDPKIADLRAKGAWTAFSDRVALFASYSRAAEHSAQQDSARLRRYEREFKAGRINVLSCSTTMEMGVDIGSVSSVMMTNVPPSIANYRQRVGRAGRRGQAVALAFTFCKDRPLDREAFRDPEGFLQRTLAAPKVTLSSRPIVVRHVNAYLLGGFMRERAGDALKMQIGAFFGCPADPAESRPLKADRPFETFVEWLERPATLAAHVKNLEILTRRSVLEGDQRLIEDTRDAIVDRANSFTAEWEGLVALAKDEGVQEAGKSRMAVELKRMCGEFLLAGLADRGFLPGHGFPTDVVSFMPGKEFKIAQDSAQDGARQFRSVGPQRSLDLAIRDYAPGSEVVLDGLVHKSAGVTLNWKRPANEENLAEIQSLRYFWQCEECGASDTRRGSGPDYCRVCGSERPNSAEFLRPAGFSVDPRDRAHADTETLSYVPPEDPVVSAREAAWRSLPAPELGRFRCSGEGLVYYSNRGGPNGFGYAICLQCGRAEADTDNRGLPAPPRALVDHKPLRYRKGVDLCPGNEKPFSVKRNISLGFEIATDVFELQLQHKLARAAAHALAIALREALAQELGIEADEMGFAVAQSRNSLGALSVSLFLFDRAAGGAGFAVSFEHRMQAVIERAENVLDCKTPGCEKGCAACVLTSDAPDGKDDLDRTAALKFLRERLAFPQRLDPEDRFVEGAVRSISSLDEIDRELRLSKRSSLTVYPSEQSAIASINDWPLAAQFLPWTMRGHPMQLAISADHMKSLSAAEKLALRDFSLQHNVTLMTGDAPTFDNGARAIAVVSPFEGNVRQIWASREPGPSSSGPAWGVPADLPVVRGKAPIVPEFSIVDLKLLLPPPGAQLVQIGSELNCDLATFGAHTSKIVVDLLTKCGTWPSGGIVQASYQDSYVASPLVARLLIDTLAQLFAQANVAQGKLAIETRAPRSPGQRGQPWQIGHDWSDAEDQKATVELLGKTRGLDVSLHHRDVPHGRYLNVTFKDGKRATIVLDQGFGAWAPPKGVIAKHDFGADPSVQAKRLAVFNAVLQRRGLGKTYFVASSG